MLLSRRVKDRPRKLRVERAREYAFEHLSAAIPQFDTIGKHLGMVGDDAQPPGFGYALNHRGSLRRSRNAYSVLRGQCCGPLQRATTLFLWRNVM